MARSAPTFNSGTISGSNNVETLQTTLETEIKAFQSNSGDAWEEYEVVTATAGSRDVVFRSLGDRTLVSGAGDAGLFARVDQSAATTIRFRGYQDWSTNDTAGVRETTSTQVQWASLSTTEDIDWFRCSNEYQCSIVIVQGSDEYYVSFGSPRRDEIPAAVDGIAFASNAETTTGSNVVVELDRDISSNIRVGQQVWIYNQTATGNAIEAEAVQILEVAAIASGSITLNLTASTAAGAIVGLDPSPMYMWGSTNSVVTTMYFTNKRDGTYTTHGNTAQPKSIHELNTSWEASTDPGPDDLYLGSEFLVNMTTAPAGPRGTLETIFNCSQGSQADNTADRMVANFSNSDRYQYFFGLQTGSRGLMIGPGA